MQWSKYQLRILKAFAVRTRKGNICYDLTLRKLFPQWFMGSPPLKHFPKIEAPGMSADLLERCLAIYKYSHGGETFHHLYSRNIVDLIVFETIFPDTFPERATDYLLQWDPANPIAIDLVEIWHDRDNPLRRCLFFMDSYPPVRIVQDQYAAEDFLNSLKEDGKAKETP